jgi:SSS family solute:Na+ symporter
MAGDIAITSSITGVFYAIVVAILYRTYRKQRDFSDYAVGGRAFGPWYICMSYLNSWFPGTVWIAFLGLGAASGVVGLYALSYSLIGVATMYFMAKRAWNWGHQFNLRTQPDMLGLRYGSKTTKVVASSIGVICLLPWMILSMQALGVLFEYMTYNELGVTAALLVGVAVIVIRQYWTVRMGMRGLVITDMFQGIIAYIVCAVLCVFLLSLYFHGFTTIRQLNETMFTFPGDGGIYGIWYFPSIIFTGIVGSLSWPTSYQRIYTANGVRNVKLGALLTMPLMLVFYGLLILVGMAGATMADVAKNPQSAWFIIMKHAGGAWLLGLGIVIVFAASMGWLDGCIQVCGTQVANDVVGSYRNMTDSQLIKLAKASMVVFLLVGAVLAYATFHYDKLVNLAIMSYQGIVQLAVPMFGGLFWRRATREGALVGMVAGFIFAVLLTAFYPDHVPWLGGATAGIPALALNLLLFILVPLVRPQSAQERARVNQLFRRGRYTIQRQVAPPARPVEPHVRPEGGSVIPSES